ncbi:MAG: M23 family metallopeptidase [Acidobacteria bacterium]|nr:M23 family metallopeptidase [Acidobacteriota bacterium]MBI3655059.1 M23 family metallopeptidase [Acidobacteriota bacterium]
MSNGRSALLILFLIPFFLLLIFALVFIKRFEGQPPVFQVMTPNGKYLGRSNTIQVKVRDLGMGLRSASLSLSQGDKTIPLFEQQYSDGPPLWKFWMSGQTKEQTITVATFEPRRQGLKEGEATLTGTATDWSWRQFLKGNVAKWQQAFTIDLTPPRLEVLTGPHYINQGGSEVLVYRVSPDAVASGIRVGDHLFPPCAERLAADPNLRFVIFAFSYDGSPDSTPIRAVARDEAGNEIQVPFSYKIFPKKFRQDTLYLTENFLTAKVPEILSYSPEIKEQESLINSYLEINGKLRHFNNSKLAELSLRSAPQRLWREPFLQLSNSQVEAAFADHRTYYYKGEAVDRQVHLGFDLAAREHYAIEAANDGKVIFADYLGIYGQAVVIDHGCGLCSIYGHMSALGVKAGDTVKKGQAIGRSGATGLAGGDHLHFSMILHGVQINPIEWWDPHWIDKHLNDRLRPFESSPATSAGSNLPH